MNRSTNSPGPVLRCVLRAPALLYRMHAGWLLGRRILLLTHRGRRSGRRYHTPLEVIGVDPARDEVMVLAGRGAAADWWRNLQAHPGLEVAIGRRRFCPLHRQLPEPDAAAVLAAYEERNRRLAPVVRRVLSRLVGWHYDGSPTARRRLVHELPVIAFRPQQIGS